MGPHPSRVVFLGLDGGTMTALQPAFHRGWMPNLASFWKRSAHGTLRSTDPMVTPVAWTSFSTGCSPLTHGIHDFHYLETSDQTVRENDATRVRVPTLWEILGHAGCQVVSLNLPMTYPCRRASGLIVAGADSPDEEAAFEQCPEFRAELAARIPEYTTRLAFKRRPRSLEALQDDARKCRAIFLAQAEAAFHADARVDWTALMVHFHNLDSLLHRAWPYLDVDDTKVSQPGWNDEVVSCLRALDVSIGRLLDLAADRDAAVIAMSDHGFGPCRALVDTNGLLEEAGLQRRTRYGTRFRYRAIRIAERFRRWRAERWRGEKAPPLARPIRGQIGCDWRRTLAYAPFGQLYGPIFLNHGATTGDEHASRIRLEIIERLRDATAPERGDSLFCDVFSVAERFQIDPAAAGLPDILAFSADGYQAQSRWPIREIGNLVRPDWNLPATHWADGIIAIDAPGTAAGRRIQAELQDVAPTVLALLGLDVPGAMEGRVLQEAFEQRIDVHRTTAGHLGPRFHQSRVMAGGAIAV